MKKRNHLFSVKHIVSSIIMLLALAWLTVSLPFVAESKKAYQNHVAKNTDRPASDNNNPFGNTNEEKTENGVSLLSEYLHEVPVLEHNYITITSFYKCHPADLYFAFHPDLIIPPPKA